MGLARTTFIEGNEKKSARQEKREQAVALRGNIGRPKRKEEKIQKKDAAALQVIRR